MAVLLAGGAGTRLGGAKPLAELGARPLMHHPLDVLMRVAERVAVICKPDTVLAVLPQGVERWDEPAEPRHPLTGIIQALERAREPVLVCAADMPWITGEACRRLVDSAAKGAPAAVAEASGRLSPTFAVYRPACLAILRAAAPGAPLWRTVGALRPVRVELPAELLRSINTPQELAAAERELRALRKGA